MPGLGQQIVELPREICRPSALHCQQHSNLSHLCFVEGAAAIHIKAAKQVLHVPLRLMHQQKHIPDNNYTKTGVVTVFIMRAILRSGSANGARTIAQHPDHCHVYCAFKLCCPAYSSMRSALLTAGEAASTTPLEPLEVLPSPAVPTSSMTPSKSTLASSLQIFWKLRPRTTDFRSGGASYLSSRTHTA